jgi:heptose-I-phosphate ethanolaminephosphotransferase
MFSGTISRYLVTHFMRLNTIFKAKADKYLLLTLLFIVLVFLISSLPIILSFILKNVNPAEYGLIKGEKEDLEVTYKEILFFTSLITAFFLLSVSFRYVKNRALKLFLKYLSLIYLSGAAIIILIDVVYYLIFSYRITFSAVQTVLNTDTEEVTGFVKLYYSAGNIIALLLFIVFTAFVIYKRNWFASLISSRSFFIATLVVTIFGIADFSQMSHSKGNGPHNVRYWDIVIGEYNEYREFNRRLAAEKNNHNLSPEYNSFYKKDSLEKILVFVISESLSKRHMSLYGYPRTTTPHLDTNNSIFKFNDCVTNAALTIEAVPGLFFNGYLSKKINLITLLNKLEYETSWISNQSGWGKGDRTIVLLSQLAKNVAFMDGMADNDKANSSLHYDEDVLGYFEKELNSPSSKSKFIVLHLMGCHFEYEKRYPIGRNFFNSHSPAKTAAASERISTTLNCYDNAVLYHDSIVNEVVKIFSEHNQNKNAALVFLSDHGEELYESRNYAGHSYPPTRIMSEIPYFTILSPEFKRNYPDIERAMKNRTNTPYSTANNFYTTLHLLNINSKKYRNKILKQGFFSPYYDSSATRSVMGIDYSKMPR